MRFLCVTAALFTGMAVGLLIDQRHSALAIAAAAVAAVAYKFTR